MVHKFICQTKLLIRTAALALAVRLTKIITDTWRLRLHLLLNQCRHKDNVILNTQQTLMSVLLTEQPGKQPAVRHLRSFTNDTGQTWT